MRQKLKVSLAETVSAMIEEQALTREELLAYLRQMMEIRALENNIAELLGKAVLERRIAPLRRTRSRRRGRDCRAARR